MKRFRAFLGRELSCPSFTGGREAIILVPLVVLGLPLAAREELFPSRPGLVAYAVIAGGFGIFWIVETMRSVIRAREDFYTKEVRPILGKEYKDG